MSSTLGDPFPLASYALPSRSAKAKGKAVALEELPVFFASYGKLPKQEDGLVTVAVQGDGVHVLDLSSLHPVSSHTLGPSTSFAAAPVTVFSAEEGHAYRRTFSLIHSASDVEEVNNGRTVWSWKESMSEGLDITQEKTVMTLSSEATAILASENLASSLLFLSKRGDITQTDLTGVVRSSWSPDGEDVSLVKSFLHTRQSCQFAPAVPTSRNGVVLSMLLVSGDVLRMQIVCFGRDGEMAASDPITVSNNNAKLVIDVSLETNGYLSTLSLDGTWNTYRIEVLNEKPTVTSISNNMRLKGLGLESKQSERVRHVHGSQKSVSVLSLGSSFVLLAGITDSESPELVLHLWDIQFAVLLAQNTLPIPASLDKRPSEISLSLVEGSSSQALLMLSPVPRNQNSKGSQSQLRASILVIPYSVPPFSTIASAFGRAEAGMRWVSFAEEPLPGQDSNTEDLLRKLQDAIEEEKPLEADDIFFTWLKEESAKLNENLVHAEEHDVEDRGQDAEENNEEEIGKEKKAHSYVRKVHLDYSLTSKFLRTVLPSDVKPDFPYSPKIVRYLIERRIVSNSMISGGLLSALLLRGDWETIQLCFRKVDDLPEIDLMRALYTVVKGQAQKASQKGAMAVDQPQGVTGCPTVVGFLWFCLNYPMSPASLRVSIRKCFADAEDLIVLLRVLDEWLELWLTKDIQLSLADVVENENGVLVAKGKAKYQRRKKHGETPDLENILAFVHAILDSSFITLLQHPPSHDYLRKFSTHIAPHVTYNEDLEHLRGPLLPFAKAHTKALADAKAGRNHKWDQEDWRRRRKQIHEQVALAIGPYQVEELVF